MKDYLALNKAVSDGLEKLQGDAPETMQAFGALMEAATAPGALSLQYKELIALSIAVALRCDGCIAHHANAVLAAGATRQEVCETLSVAIMMGGGPAVVYGIEALTAFDQFTEAGRQDT